MVKLYLKDIYKKHICYTKKNQNPFRLKVDKLTINKGELFGFIGPSGCGKTTLLKIIAGLYRIDKGKIYIENKDITNIIPEKRNIGMVFQQPLLFPHMTVEENICFGLKMKKISKSDRKYEVKKILNIVGLKGFKDRYPSQLSGGQKQRVSLARSLVLKPEILLMDEPFSALDPELRKDMRKLILDIHKKYETTIIFVTHDRLEAFTLFDRMAIIKEGEILQIGHPNNIYEKPCNSYVAKFLGVNNVFLGSISKKVFSSGKLKIKLEDNELNKEGYIVLRPEILEVKKIKKQDNYNDKLYGVIKDSYIKKGFLFCKVQIGDKSLETVQKNRYGFNFQVGESVVLGYDKSQIWFINNR